MTDMERRLQLRIITLSGTVLDTPCESVRLPLLMGSAAVYPGHAPMLALSESGVIRWHCGGELRYAAVSGGTAEVRDDRVTLLVDGAKMAQTAEEARQYAANMARIAT